jgi:hypothetical protein
MSLSNCDEKGHFSLTRNYLLKSFIRFFKLEELAQKIQTKFYSIRLKKKHNTIYMSSITGYAQILSNFKHRQYSECNKKFEGIFRSILQRILANK